MGWCSSSPFFWRGEKSLNGKGRGVSNDLQAHEDFWKRRPCRAPLVSFRLGDTLVSRHFNAARHLLVEHTRITPEMIHVEDFLADYERMWNDAQSIGQSGIWTGEPFTGIPWMEAMLGCDVFGSVSSFVTEPCVKSLVELERIRFDAENPWFLKYIDFTKKLVEVSAGRFPVGEPIMRGPSDVVGALVGQSSMILMMNDYPEEMERIFNRVSTIFRGVIRAQQALVPPHRGGYSFGFYHLWAPGKCIWFQEDLSALFSPDYYRRFLKRADESICRDFEFTLVHLHPSSFFILDDLLGIKGLRAIEVNKDVGGPSVQEMLPTMERIQREKNLVVWGELSVEDVDTILRSLPERRMHLSIVSPSVDYAKRIMEKVLSAA